MKLTWNTSEPLECDECEGCEVQLYRANFLLKVKVKNFTLCSHASHSSHPSHPIPFTPQINTFLREWFGIHGGREIFQPTPKDRVFIEKAEDLASYLEVCRSLEAPAWMSVQPYQERDVIFGLEKLFFDFDCETDLEKAWSDAYDFASKLIKYYGIKPLLVFSGQKGYHLYVFLWSTVQFQVHRQETAKEIYSRLQEKLLKGLVYETLDRQVIGDIKRLARIPYSIHEKTGQTCQPLTLDRQPLWLGPNDLDVLRKHGIYREFFEKVCKEAGAKKKVKARHEFKHLSLNKPASTIRPCIENAVTHPLDEKQGHLMRLAVAREYLNAGFQTDDVVALFKNQLDFDAEKSRYYVEYARRNRCKPFRCSKIESLGYCLYETCPIFKKRGGKKECLKRNRFQLPTME